MQPLQEQSSPPWEVVRDNNKITERNAPLFYCYLELPPREVMIAPVMVALFVLAVANH